MGAQNREVVWRRGSEVRSARPPIRCVQAKHVILGTLADTENAHVYLKCTAFRVGSPAAYRLDRGGRPPWTYHQTEREPPNVHLTI